VLRVVLKYCKCKGKVMAKFRFRSWPSVDMAWIRIKGRVKVRIRLHVRA
jgi:hypothetical protein